MGVVLALPEEEEKRSQSHDRGVGAAVVVPDCSEWVGKVVGSRMSAPMVENGNTSGDGRPDGMVNRSEFSTLEDKSHSTSC